MKSDKITEEQLDAFGMILSKWANLSGFSVKINGLAMHNVYDTQTAGSGWTAWDDGKASDSNKISIKKLRANFLKVLSKSECNTDFLISYFNNLEAKLEPRPNRQQARNNIPSKEELAKDLKSLGKITFTPLPFSSD